MIRNGYILDSLSNLLATKNRNIIDKSLKFEKFEVDQILRVEIWIMKKSTHSMSGNYVRF